MGIARLLPGKTPLAPAASASAGSIAVFAFENLKDPDDPERLGQILQELLITDLSGHDALDILSSQRLFDLHRQIAGGGASRIDRSAFTEVATRAGASAMLTGTMSRLGDRWILASQLVDLGSGKVTTSERIDGDDLYRMVDELTGRIYSDLAPAKTAPAGDVAVAKRTSSSLPAYQLYLEGVELLSRREYAKAETKLQEALGLDPDFGQARLRLAIATWWANDNRSGGEVAKEILLPLVDGTLKVSERDQLLARGMYPILDQRYADGEPLLQRMTERYPDDKDAWYGLGEARWHKSPPDTEGAVVALTRALELDPAFLPAFTHLRGYYSGQRRYTEAIRAYRGLMRGHPDQLLWYTSLHGALVAHGDEDEAEALFEETLARFPSERDRRDIWRTAADTYRDVGNIVRVMECMDELLAIDPTDPFALLGHGWAHFELNRWEEAERWWRRTEDATADDSGEQRAVTMHRLFVAWSEGRTADAVQLAEQRVERWGEGAHPLLAQSYLRNNQPTEAARLLESAVDSAESVRARQRRLSFTSWLYRRADEHRQAVDFALRGIAMEGGEELSWLLDDLPTSYVYLGQYDEAEAAAKRVLEVAPRSLFEGEFVLLTLDLLRGNPAGAEQRLRSILADGPVTSDFRALLAVALAEQGRYGEAETEARWAFARKPSEKHHVILAWVLIAGDRNVDEGIALAEIAISMPRVYTDTSRLRVHAFLPSREHALGLGYLKERRYREAVRLLEQAAELQPGKKLIAEHLAEAKRLAP